MTYDEYGYPKLTIAKARKVVETLIPDHLRQFVCGIEIDWNFIDYDFPTAYNLEILINFLPPVVGTVDGSRYAHANLCELEDALKNDIQIDPLSIDDPDYEDYDEWCEGCKVIPTKKHTINFPWKKKGN